MSENLLELQEAFQDHLLDPNLRTIHRSIVSTERMPTELRLAIYAHGYYARLVEALSTTYPSLLIYLGFETFNEMGYEYSQTYPSAYRSIRWFGDRLDQFLKENKKYNDRPYLAELATVEWTMSSVFDAADANILPLAALAAIPPEDWINITFQPHPSVQRLNLSWNVISIWQSIANNQQSNEPVKNASPVPWLFWRKNLVNQFCSLSAHDAWALDVMLSGQTFGEICEGLSQWFDEENVAIQAASLLKGWILADLISAVKT